MIRLERGAPAFVEFGPTQCKLKDFGARHLRIHFWWKVVENDVGIQVHEDSRLKVYHVSIFVYYIADRMNPASIARLHTLHIVGLSHAIWQHNAVYQVAPPVNKLNKCQ